uniref:Radial spoke head protein 9 homolog n=1 Tax=Favella ehrenbergii TaxID=182087 RepID=A0A7S3MLL3_9SPIT|mmetsp:Transcript_25063/g.31385  ORF Transcript_25063/g.31385 Transcript_25063/m.31385 type:complete len:305 (+) Transcript_25063:29-943(+)|eukprot:CAMPEP_0170467658 /NCGR_PEP_ID=MMETSP0123-20130129/11164_1 /TAXON_ID=182087 /ORGANISM="Favella ehrenbergii, Strain Fehren 1" /LENGTH=304 /DNA_ID=CAMNT_0010734099 /DNA_START=6 /DNA_END=920 /DNA_ORIENTATION=+
MDILDFSEEIKNFRHNGVTLNLDERMQIDMALNTLLARVETEELSFWGKIEGIKNDYYIAMGMRFRNMYEFPVKTFFWALSGEFIFREMPDLTGQHDALIDADTSYFQGMPTAVLSGKKDIEEEEQAEAAKSENEEEEKEEKAKNSDETSEEEVKVPTRPLTELDRLTTTVRAIENDCQICPVGAFKMTPEHQVRRNEAFNGLNAESGMRLANYLHFRNVQDEAKRAELDLPTAPFNERFLESASVDQPRGCWSMQKDERGDSVMVRSLQWPGYQFFHRLNSSRFGAIYVGDGLKNLEIHFIVQ